MFQLWNSHQVGNRWSSVFRIFSVEPAITEVQEENLLDTDLSKPPELPEEILMTPPPDHYASDENAALPFPRLQYLNLSHNKVSCIPVGCRI